MWSHHEKMVIIDQEIGFLGGLDLCFGRMDSNKHFLGDKPFNDSDLNDEVEFWPGIDYSNSRVRDFFDVSNHKFPLISKDTQPRMPWHDIAMRVIGDFFFFFLFF